MEKAKDRGRITSASGSTTWAFERCRNCCWSVKRCDLELPADGVTQVAAEVANYRNGVPRGENCQS
jgi:hypothetical protein